MDAAAWDARYRDESRVWSREPNMFVAQQLAALPPGRAVDLAGGEGRNAIWLAERGWEVEVVDFSPVALDKAQRFAAEAGVALTTTCADVIQNPPIEPADLVLVTYLQVDAASREHALRYAAGLVKPGGTLFIVAHALRNFTEGTGGPSDPALLYDLDATAAIVADCGLQVTLASEVTRPVETDDGSRDAIDILVQASRP